jgi:divalent metal cation (Fe/Co/Zn/Cd) transporter
MNLLREIATGLSVVVVTLVVLYVAVGAASLILGLCIYLSPHLFGPNYFGLAILTGAWIVVGIAYLVVCALVGRTGAPAVKISVLTGHVDAVLRKHRSSKLSTTHSR